MQSKACQYYCGNTFKLSIFLFKIPHRAFRHPYAHSIGFRASLNILLKTACPLDLQDSCSLIQNEVRG